MNRVTRVLCLGGLLIGAPVAAQAAPLGATGNRPIAEEPTVTKVHGYHGSCRWGHGWRHRHLRSGRPVGCRHIYRYYYSPYYYGPSVVLRFGHRHHHHHRHHRHGRRH